MAALVTMGCNIVQREWLAHDSSHLHFKRTSYACLSALPTKAAQCNWLGYRSLHIFKRNSLRQHSLLGTINRAEKQISGTAFSFPLFYTIERDNSFAVLEHCSACIHPTETAVDIQLKLLNIFLSSSCSWRATLATFLQANALPQCSPIPSSAVLVHRISKYNHPCKTSCSIRSIIQSVLKRPFCSRLCFFLNKEEFLNPLYQEDGTQLYQGI